MKHRKSKYFNLASDYRSTSKLTIKITTKATQYSKQRAFQTSCHGDFRLPHPKQLKSCSTVQIFVADANLLPIRNISTIFTFYLCHIYLRFYISGSFNHWRSTIRLLQQVEIATPLPNSNFCIARHLSSWQIYTIVHSQFLKCKKYPQNGGIPLNWFKYGTKLFLVRFKF